MKRCVVIGGALIENYKIVKTYLKPEDFYIFCDCGLRHVQGLGVKPDLIIGDFDSYKNPQSDTETIVLPREKDDTDTVFGVKEGIRRGFTDFLLIGVIGQRFDHTMANISILYMLDKEGYKGMIVDDYSEMEIVSGDPVFIEDKYPYFSLLNISGTAKNIKISNAKWSKESAEITPDYQYGVSNEVLPGKTASVCVGEGRLLLIRVR